MSDPWAWRSNMDAPRPSPLATLKPGPEPTGSQRVQDAIYGWLGGRPENRATASALAGLFDVGTLGMATGAYDGAKELGQTGQPGSLAMALMPGAKVAAPVAQAATQAAKKGIRAFHGSPHDFDRFDLSKIGTGEGAQAYGHGLYFAESEGVARSYRDKLTGTSKLKINGQDYDSRNPEHLAAYSIMVNNGDRNAAAQAIADQGGYVRSSKRLSEMFDDAARMARSPDWTPPKIEGGKMYEVNIKADPEDFLDWDKPLAEQSEKVRRAFEGANVAPFYNMRGELVPVEQRRGEAAYHSLAEALGTPFDPARPRMAEKPNPAAATQYLKERGIAGTRYLDGQSRDGGEGTRNLALFDDSLIEILRKYGLLPPAVAGGVAASQSDAQAGQ